MCSTFKAFAAAAVLRDRAGCAPLDRVVHYPPHDLLPNSPRTEENVATGMTVADLCAAAIPYQRQRGRQPAAPGSRRPGRPNPLLPVAR